MSQRVLLSLCLCGNVSGTRSQRDLTGGMPLRLREVALGLRQRVPFGFLARRGLGAREPRAGVDIVDRAVIHVAELVRFDLDRPARELEPPAFVAFGLHDYGFSTGAPTKLPHSVHEPS